MVWVEKVGIGIGSGGERKPVNVITYGGCCTITKEKLVTVLLSFTERIL